MRINVGCGMSPTPGWVNLDNSPAVRLARQPIRRWLLKAFGLLGQHQLEYIRYCQQHEIRHADGLKLPFPDGTVEVIYTSHTLEHLDREDAKAFIAGAFRKLSPGGVLRIAVPDLRYYAEKYLQDGELESFLFYLHMIGPPTRTLKQKLVQLAVGKRHHQWMYDGPHLTGLLTAAGYTNVRVLKPGETTVTNPGSLNLHERVPESLFVEGQKP